MRTMLALLAAAALSGCSKDAVPVTAPRPSDRAGVMGLPPDRNLYVVPCGGAAQIDVKKE